MGEDAANPTDAQIADAASGTEKADLDWVELPSSDALTEITSQQVLFSAQCSRVLLVGAVGSGKTSILTGIYERLCRGSLEGWTFVGSSTLIGFEKRCWEGRTNSGGNRDQIGRTSLQSDDYLLHLHVANAQARRINLLMADLSGEVFKEIKYHPGAAGALPILQAADHLTIVVDGARLADPRERQVAINDGVAALRACVAFGRLRDGVAIELVIAKWDAAVAAELDMPWANEYVFDALRRVVEGDRPVGAFVTASRPTSGDFELGTGVANLVTAWAELPRPLDSAPVPLPPETRAYLRFGQ